MNAVLATSTGISLLPLTRNGGGYVARAEIELQTENSNQGEILCSPLFATTILIRRTVLRSTAEYARSSCPSSRRRRDLCATIGLILVRARARPSASLRTK